MHILLKKFGDILTSREAGREAYSAFLPTLNSLGNDEEIKIDFEGVSVLTPSWADEFLRPVLKKYDKKISFIHDTNPSVQSALRFANPKLDLNKITIFEDKIVFDERTDEKNHDGQGAHWMPTFPYTDEEALHILINNKVKKIHIYAIDNLGDSRLKTVMQMLKQAGIETVIINK